MDEIHDLFAVDIHLTGVCQQRIDAVRKDAPLLPARQGRSGF